MNVSAEAEGIALDALLNDTVEPDKGAAANEQDVIGIERRGGRNGVEVGGGVGIGGRQLNGGAFEDFEKSLLNAFAGNIAGNAGGLAGDFVDFVNINNAALGGRQVAIGVGEQRGEDVLNVLPDVTGFGERIGVGDINRNVEDIGEGMNEEGFAGAGGTNHENVGFLKVDAVI